MPRPALTDEQRRQTRRKIRRVAAELYAGNGFEGLSVRAIAQAAGVSVGTIYSYFSNLTELMQSLWKEPVSQLLETFEVIEGAQDDPQLRIRAMLQAYLEFSSDQRAVYRGAFLFVRPESHQRPVPVSLEQDRLFGFLRHAIIKGQVEGVFREGEPNLLTQMLWSGLHGAIALPMNVDRLALDGSGRVAEHMLDALLTWLETTDMASSGES